MREDDKSRWHRKISNILAARREAPLQDRPDPYDPRKPQLRNRKIDQKNYHVGLLPGKELLRKREIDENLTSGVRIREKVNRIVTERYRSFEKLELLSTPRWARQTNLIEYIED